MVYTALRSLLFKLEAERAHEWATGALALAQRSRTLRAHWHRRWAVSDPRLEQEVLGLRFANPVGIAAGFDKNARLVPALAAFGFGAVEVGTVTPRPQPGNPRPRLWRHPAARSLQNCLGFNSAGMEAVAENLRRLGTHPVPVGLNLGKNRQTDQAAAQADYEALLVRFADIADYFVLNISSPNTPRLRELQVPDFVRSVLATAAEITAAPVLVKIAPDMPVSAAVELAVAAVEAGAAGLIATNTTIDYDAIPGAPAVGGIDSAADAYRRLRAGASLVQLYTALIYDGPRLAGRINHGLIECLERDGLADVRAAIGADL